MQFELNNAPRTFQRVVDFFLSKLKGQYALVYLEDFIVFSKSGEQHFDYVSTVVSILKDVGV